jgi:antitoxin ParD1/3/4
MTTMNISLPDGLKSFVDERVASEGYGTSSEYVRELIRRDKDRREFKEHLLAGLRSGTAGPMDNTYFAQLRNSLKKSAKLTP